MSGESARVAVTIRRWVDDCQPGLVECSLVDASGKEWLFVEKAPVVSSESLWRDSQYPRDGQVACRVVASWLDGAGRNIVRIDTDDPWHVDATSGETVFEVLRSQLEFEAE